MDRENIPHPGMFVKNTINYDIANYSLNQDIYMHFLPQDVTNCPLLHQLNNCVYNSQGQLVCAKLDKLASISNIPNMTSAPSVNIPYLDVEPSVVSTGLETTKSRETKPIQTIKPLTY
jgi:hypothetical protein